MSPKLTYEHSNMIQIEGGIKGNTVLYAELVMTFYELSPPVFKLFILCLIILTSNPTLEQKRATFTKKK